MRPKAVSKPGYDLPCVLSYLFPPVPRRAPQSRESWRVSDYDVGVLSTCNWRLEMALDQTEILRWPAELPEVAAGTHRRLIGHHAQWIDGITRGLGHQGYLIKTTRDQRATGVLPLVKVSGPLFGKFLVSLPYINTGGVWAEDDLAATKLVDAACDLADELDVRYLELRHEVPVQHPRINFARTDKVHMRLPLPDSDELLDKSFKSKLRSQIKKSTEYGMTVHWGDAALLDDFYRVFSQNMRDLGTPVFSKGLFSSLLQSLAGTGELCVVRSGGSPVAGAVVVHLDGASEVPSASSLRQYNHTGANMLMYRHLLARAIERKSRLFDFGRSSVNSGTYKFKAQWGALPHHAEWQYYVRKGSVDAMRPDSRQNRRLIRVWQRLPVWLTNVMGPGIVRGIP
jgi:FemAB-related protein (PEP-CTERM system-associated)